MIVRILCFLMLLSCTEKSTEAETTSFGGLSKKKKELSEMVLQMSGKSSLEISFAIAAKLKDESNKQKYISYLDEKLEIDCYRNQCRVEEK